MIDERQFIERVERSDISEFADLLARPTLDDEHALRAYFGDERYRKLHATALRRRIRKAIGAPEGNVVFLHGIMGGELTAYRGGSGYQIWAKPIAILKGAVTRLQLAEDGRTDLERGTQVQASGILKSAYAEILIALADRWNVRAFWYDWRKDISLAAAELATKIDGWFGPEAAVHLVAHSMGGLVARAFIRDHEARWMRMWDGHSARKGTRGGRLVMLGTPNHGSFAIPQVMTGIEGIARKLAAADLQHDLTELLPVLNSFLGSYQMLPSPLVLPAYDWLYKADAYPNVKVSQGFLDEARLFQRSLRDVVHPERMKYIAGFNQLTFDGIKEPRRPDLRESYTVTRNGDGRVPHVLGSLTGVPMFFVEESHGDLAANEQVISAVEDLMETGDTTAIASTLPKSRATLPPADASPLWLDQDLAVREVQRMTRRTSSRGMTSTPPDRLADEERLLRDRIVDGLLPTARRSSDLRSSVGPVLPLVIKFAVAVGQIQKMDDFDRPDLPVDAISVGHYIGVRPVAAEQKLDLAISEALRQSAPPRSAKASSRQPLSPDDGILAQYAARGTLRGELGQPFFLPDPRLPEGQSGTRTIAIAGMGYPGRFGEPELIVAVRELCWALGRMGRKHLATVLIGGGSGNMPIELAVSAWFRGIFQALQGAAPDESHRLTRITFVEVDPRRALAIHRAVSKDQVNGAPGFTIDYDPPPERALAAWRVAGSRRASEEWLAEQNRNHHDVDHKSANPAPTRLTIEFNQGVYRFGAITETASIPERNLQLDPHIVMDANDDLIGVGDTQLQRERGEVLGKLLVPEDLRSKLSSKAPIILSVDAAMARIHWELIAHEALPVSLRENPTADAGLDSFLGSSRGLTRQLRTPFAPAPEPPPPPHRVLRVLVVADPAPDAHLPGAEEEGAAVAHLFQSFNTVYADRADINRIEVVTMLGPHEATRINVLGKLMTSAFDVLHFAGHCKLSGDAATSGWMFSQTSVLSANELNRIDRIPKFVFSNACESGVMPDRPRDRNVDLAPSFAESFFARGVANFVCTAWPVDDVAAREFAVTLYAGLLGLAPVDGPSGRYQAAPVLLMHEAMRRARRAVANCNHGTRTWGAYQHYGDPYLRFFDASDDRRVDSAGERPKQHQKGGSGKLRAGKRKRQ